MNIRHLALLLGLTLAAIPYGASAETYPERTVRFIVPNPPGGGTDIVARIVAERLSEKWGRSVIVENKPGGGGDIGAQFVSRAKPDGYTIFAGYGGVLAVNEFLYRDLGFDPHKDLMPITLTASAAFAVAVNPSVPVQTLQELIALLKANPGKYSWASTSVGTQDHIGGELLQLVTGTKMTHVPYKGGAEGLLDVVANRVPIDYVTIPTSLAQIKDGRLRALAVTGAERSPLLPEVPTVKEAGASGAENLTWFGLWAPAGTSTALVDKIANDVHEVLAPPEVQDKLTKNGFTSQVMSPAEFDAFVKSEREKYGKVIATLNIPKQ